MNPIVDTKHPDGSQSTNPANTRVSQVSEATRIPMSLPRLKLQVPDLPGYHLHWMRGEADRIQQALQAGYEFVDRQEVYNVNTGLANDPLSNGSTDLGTRVSVVAGGVDESGQASRLYLMKLKQDWWEKDQKLLAERNELVASALRGGGDVDSNPFGSDHRYIPKGYAGEMKSMFTRKN